MRIYVVLGLIFMIGLSGCGTVPAAAEQLPRPTATIAPFFTGEIPPVPTISFPALAPRPTSVVLAPTSDAAIRQSEARRDATDALVFEVPIFDDQLLSGWSLEHSWDLQINPQSPVFAASGQTSLAAAPRVPFSGMFLANIAQTTVYRRADVLGVRFYVSGGANFLEPDSLIVRMAGSNLYPYHVEGDSSVRFPDRLADNRLVFPEIGLDSLGMRRVLEPGEWAEVELWLDGYDQVDYAYVTGLVVMNSEAYMRSFYVDRVVLLIRRP